MWQMFLDRIHIFLKIGIEPWIFWFLVYYLFQKHRVRPLGYCAPEPFMT